MTTAPRFKRILLKLSGEALMGDAAFGLDAGVLQHVAGEVKGLVEAGVGLGLVIGAGNFVRGATAASKGMNRVAGDNMGMLATVMNSLAVGDVLTRHGVPSRVMSAIPMPPVCETYSNAKALHHLDKGRVVLLAGGSGNPFFTTDTAGVLRALEIGAGAICKATRVDGVYDKDPLKHADAVKFDRLTYAEVLQRRLKVMDSTAISLAMDHNLTILVVNMNVPGNILKAIRGGVTGTIIQGEAS